MPVAIADREEGGVPRARCAICDQLCGDPKGVGREVKEATAEDLNTRYCVACADSGKARCCLFAHATAVCLRGPVGLCNRLSLSRGDTQGCMNGLECWIAGSNGSYHDSKQSNSEEKGEAAGCVYSAEAYASNACAWLVGS